jgi:hypothetical protein
MADTGKCVTRGEGRRHYPTRDLPAWAYFESFRPQTSDFGLSLLSFAIVPRSLSCSPRLLLTLFLFINIVESTL